MKMKKKPRTRTRDEKRNRKRLTLKSGLRAGLDPTPPGLFPGFPYIITTLP
jgi:hypothetical protein